MTLGNLMYALGRYLQMPGISEQTEVVIGSLEPDDYSYHIEQTKIASSELLHNGNEILVGLNTYTIDDLDKARPVALVNPLEEIIESGAKIAHLGGPCYEVTTDDAE